MDRKITTALLSNLLETHINPNNDNRVYWAKEVTFDYASENHIRVDYMKFEPVNNTISGIEKGDFYCYEIKSSVEDFHSKNGHNFIDDYNYYVIPKEVFGAIKSELPYGIGVYCPTEDYTELKLIRVAKRKNREKSVVEMLLMMFRSANRDRNITPLNKDDIVELIKQAKEKTQQHGYWTRELVFERDWDGGHTTYHEYTCSVCGHEERYSPTKKCYYCGAIIDDVKEE